MARPVPQRSLSRELDLNDSNSLKPGVRDGNVRKPDLIQALEAQADEM